MVGDGRDEIAHIPECTAVVRLLLLAVDAGLALGVDADGKTKDPDVILVEHLSPLSDVLHCMGTHPYLCEVKAHRALIMLLTILLEMNDLSNFEK